MGDWTVGVDIGGTKIEVIVVDPSGHLRSRRRQPTNTHSSDYLLDDVTTAVYRALDAAGIAPKAVGAFGVGVPGQVNPLTGLVGLAVNLNLYDYPLGARLAARLGRPVVVENDIRLAALGAYRNLVPATIRHFAYLGVGTGVAAGLILDGKLHRGAHGMAGEVGHMTVLPNGHTCKCGNQGCLETVISGPAILRLARERWRGDEPAPTNVAAVFAAAESGHSTAQAIVNHVATVLARALYTLFLAYDVEMIVIGGGVSRAGEALLRPLQEEMTRRSARSPLTALLLKHDKIRLLPADFNAGAWGGVWLAQERNASLEAPME